MNFLQRILRFTATTVLLFAVSMVQAVPWAVVVDAPQARISMLDFGTSPATVYGPFLAGELGNEGGSTFEVAITPDGKTALISNFGDACVYRVDISVPTNPVVTGSISNGFFAEDIAISPDGKTAIVTDGGWSSSIGIIDLTTFTTSITYSVTSGYANAVAIAPDNQTVIFADYFGSQIIYGELCPTGLVSESVHEVYRPVNVAIAPDGKTVLTANVGTNMLNVFKIESPGNVVTGDTPSVFAYYGFHAQSIAFSPAGDKAYVLQNGILDPDGPDPQSASMLSWLSVNSPGNVTIGGTNVVTLPNRGSSQLFGVDTLAVSPDGAWILAGNPTLSGATSTLAVVNSATFAVQELDVSQEKPVGVAFVRNYVFNDYDGDSMSELAVFRNGYWSIFSLAHGMILLNAGDWGDASCTPVPGDYDGDGKSDLAFYRAGYWSVFSLANGIVLLNAGDWGDASCTPVPGDYDGDGLADLAFYRDGYWSIFSLANGIVLLEGGPWGDASCTPVPGDYDGDGLADLAFYRDGYWSIYSLANGVILANAGDWGDASCTPVPGDYDGDGKSDLAFYRAGYWSVFSLANGVILANAGVWGDASCTPVPGDYDRDGKSDLNFYLNGYWSSYSLANGIILNNAGELGGSDWIPVK
ncbi:MAG: hypothetical protein ABIH24_01560 [Verrucomicrobiota bacterium]